MNPNPFAVRTLMTLVVTLPLSACYQYVQVEQDVVPEAGHTVRAHLSPLQSFDLGWITINEIESVEGEVYREEGGRLGLWTQWLYSRYGTRHEATGSVFYIPREQIQRLDERRMVPGKTALATIGIVVAVVGTFELARRSLSNSTPGPGPPPTGLQSVVFAP